MIVRTLLENTSLSAELGCEHGLSLHIETEGRRILFDTGRTGLFAENAARMAASAWCHVPAHHRWRRAWPPPAPTMSGFSSRTDLLG